MRSATIAHGVNINGRGLFSGEPASCKVRPWEADKALRMGWVTSATHHTGIVFMQSGSMVAADPQFYYEQPNCSVLMSESGDATVVVIEHILAALWAAGIDHAEIQMQGIEVPNQDGSARPIYDLIAAAGATELGERPQLELPGPIRVEGGDGSYIEFSPGADLHVDYFFGHPELGEESYSAQIDRAMAVDELLPARTFITVSEVQVLRNAGLLRNEHAEDALLLRPDGEGGYTGNSALRFENEFARHKVLDLLGDLYIVPAELSGRIRAYRSGHRLNRQLARELMKLL
jgi:UDP-3-O-acyl-N-acetylglucosamine deacetylase